MNNGCHASQRVRICTEGAAPEPYFNPCYEDALHSKMKQCARDFASEGGSPQVRSSDVLSAWSGIRPLAADPTQTSTENLSRDHVVAVEPDGLLTVAGGKWTTYRKMAEDAVRRPHLA